MRRAAQQSCGGPLEEVKNFIKDMKSAESNRHLQKAREIYKPLLQFNQQLLIEMHVDLPVNVTSIPSGSRLKLNGKFRRDHAHGRFHSGGNGLRTCRGAAPDSRPKNTPVTASNSKT